MKKKLLAIITCGLIAAMALCFTGCSSDSTESSSQEAEVTYESILNDYTQKLEQQAPTLVEEYNSEAKEKAGDIDALAQLSNDKISELAATSNEGIQEMAKLQQKNGDDYSTYEEWAQKLTDVYMDQAQTITDAYMESAA